MVDANATTDLSASLTRSIRSVLITSPLAAHIKPQIQEYCEDQLDVIRRINGIASLHTPVSFVCIAAFIGYLSRLVYGNNKAHDQDAKMYIRFVTDIMGSIKSDYGKIANDLYYVFRCGIVHSMSFRPPVDASTPTCNIAISHDVQTKWQAGKGFYSTTKHGITYTVLNADDLILDLFKVIDYIFADSNLNQHAINFAKVQPPIQGL